MSRIKSGSMDIGSFFTEPEPIKIEEKVDSIIITYIEKILIPYEHKKVFKVIFSCVDGKWHKSERIYGVVIPSSKESYEFDDL